MRQRDTGVVQEREEDEEEVGEEIREKVHENHKTEGERLDSLVEAVEDGDEADVAHDDEDALRGRVDGRGGQEVVRQDRGLGVLAAGEVEEEIQPETHEDIEEHSENAMSKIELVKLIVKLLEKSSNILHVALVLLLLDTRREISAVLACSRRQEGVDVRGHVCLVEGLVTGV